MVYLMCIKNLFILLFLKLDELTTLIKNRTYRYIMTSTFHT